MYRKERRGSFIMLLIFLSAFLGVLGGE